MIKFQYASDLHLEFSDNWSYLKQNPLEVAGDVLLLAGDIGYLGDDNYSTHPFWDWVSENYTQVIIALGNHEFYKQYDIKTLQNGFCHKIRDNVRCYYNAVVTIDDVDIIVSTLWSVIEFENAYYTEQCITDFRRIRYGDEQFTSSEFNREHIKCRKFIEDAVKESDARKKIVLTHHVPSFQVLSDEFYGSRLNGAFTVELADYIEISGIDFWVYGHSHRNIDTKIGNTHILTNQLGYVFADEHHSFNNQRYIEV